MGRAWTPGITASLDLPSDRGPDRRPDSDIGFGVGAGSGDVAGPPSDNDDALQRSALSGPASLEVEADGNTLPALDMDRVGDFDRERPIESVEGYRQSMLAPVPAPAPASHAVRERVCPMF